MERINAELLTEFVRSVFSRLGLPEADAGTVADCLVRANLRGVDSHGVFRVPTYARRLREGLVAARPELRPERVTAAAATLDGQNGMGAVVGTRAMAEALALAADSGIGLVLARRSTHFGMAAFYVLQAIRAGYIGMVFTNASPALPPWGGRAPFLGTSPLAVGVPSGRESPFVLDMAMTVLARGNVYLALARGERMPPGLALDRDGRPTVDPEAFLEGGTMLPFGGLKGAALSMMMDILGGVLTGAAFAGRVGNPHRDFDRPQNVGHLFLAIRPDLAMPREEFLARMDEFVAAVKTQPRAAGFGEILIPGEREARIEAERRHQGIPLPPEVIGSLRAEAAALGLEFAPAG